MFNTRGDYLFSSCGIYKYPSRSSRARKRSEGSSALDCVSTPSCSLGKSTRRGPNCTSRVSMLKVRSSSLDYNPHPTSGFPVLCVFFVLWAYIHKIQGELEGSKFDITGRALSGLLRWIGTIERSSSSLRTPSGHFRMCSNKNNDFK